MTPSRRNTVKRNCSLLLVILLLTAFGAVSADAAGGVELQTTAEVEIVAENPDGTVSVSREAAIKVVPGDEVVYTMRFRNTADDAAEDVVIINPVPEHMTLLRTGRLAPDLNLTFSVDGGRSFGALAELQVTGADGRPRPATAADCTHLRWSFRRPLAPGEEGQVDYVAQLQ
jgi:uncharacterized repeat protein (TIGR01451 family)